MARQAGQTPGRYHKIGVDEQAFSTLFTQCYGGLVRVSARRVRVALASGYPWKETFRQVAGNIRRAWEPS